MFNSTTSRLTVFAAGLAITGAGAAAIGAATQATPPLQDCLKTAAVNAGFGSDNMPSAGHGGSPMIEAVPGSDGLHSEVAGLRLVPLSRTLHAGSSTSWRFRIIDCGGNVVRSFDRENTKLLHLIVVRTDLTGYQHLHPTLESDGTFSVEIATRRAGTYRAITDFVVDGRKYVLGTNLTSPGRSARTPLPAPALEASTDGYHLELQRPAELRAGQEAQLTFRITRQGRPVSDLQPYLGGLMDIWSPCTPPSSATRTCTPTAPTAPTVPSRSTPSCRTAATTACFSSSGPMAASTRSSSPRPSPNPSPTRKDHRMQTSYSVPGVSCGHCRTAITSEVSRVAGVSAIDVDLERKVVTVTGAGLNEAAIRDAIDEAGYDIA